MEDIALHNMGLNGNTVVTNENQHQKELSGLRGGSPGSRLRAPPTCACCAEVYPTASEYVSTAKRLRKRPRTNPLLGQLARLLILHIAKDANRAVSCYTLESRTQTRGVPWSYGAIRERGARMARSQPPRE